MKIQIEYAQHIIVAVVFNTIWSWYVTEKDYWYLDLMKLEQAFLDKDYELPNVGDYSERFNIAILNENSAEKFLEQINECKVSTAELRESLIASDPHNLDSLIEFVPSLFVDFDKKSLRSQFPEPASFENYIPDGWIGSYENFIDQVPMQEKYWIIEGKDYFTKE